MNNLNVLSFIKYLLTISLNSSYLFYKNIFKI